VEGNALSGIAALFRVSKDALSRHKTNHIPATLVKAQEAQEVAQADDLLDQIRNLQVRTLTILEAAEASGEYRTALAAIGEARRNIELLGRTAGELDERPQVNLCLSSEWSNLRTLVVGALKFHPEAKAAVVAALGAAGGYDEP
jgi:hypothetical protein